MTAPHWGGCVWLMRRISPIARPSFRESETNEFRCQTMSNTRAMDGAEGRHTFVKCGATISNVSATPVAYAKQVGSSIVQLRCKSLPYTLLRTVAPLAACTVKAMASARMNALNEIPHNSSRSRGHTLPQLKRYLSRGKDGAFGDDRIGP